MPMYKLSASVYAIVLYTYSGNVDANNSLILKGRYQQKHIETVLRRYISKFIA